MLLDDAVAGTSLKFVWFSLVEQLSMVQRAVQMFWPGKDRWLTCGAILREFGLASRLREIEVVDLRDCERGDCSIILRHHFDLVRLVFFGIGHAFGLIGARIIN